MECKVGLVDGYTLGESLGSYGGSEGGSSSVRSVRDVDGKLEGSLLGGSYD